MSDLIERLRMACSLPTGLYGEAADELERLQSQITAMTKDMESMKPWRELKEELAALKAQSTEPVAWMFQHEETGRTMCVETQQVECGFEQNNPRLQKICPLYTTPPTATALVEDFRKRAVEVVMGNWLNLDRTTKVYMKVAIESLPLIKGEK